MVGTGLSVLSGDGTLHGMITYNGHLVTSVVYFQPPPIFVGPSGQPVIQIP